MEQNPVTTGNCNSPLVWDETTLGAMRAFCRRNQPVLCSPFVLGGANTPASVPATVAQLNAEALSALAYTQIIRRGCPEPGVLTDNSPSGPALACWSSLHSSKSTIGSQGSWKISLNKRAPARSWNPKVAALVAFLAAGESGFVAGQVYTVDLDRMAKLSLPQ